jgi:Zn-finger nucleic acid-binding protein
MNCPSCGAPMQLFDRRRYYFCAYCGAFHFIDPPAVEGVQVLERSSAARPCPLCGAPLAKSLLDDAYPVQHCERCRGLLLSRAAFADAIGRRRAAASGPGVAPVSVDPRELHRKMVCPMCGARMDVHPYFGPGNIVIDTCSRCDVIWLDSGELKQITDAPGRDRAI